MRIYLPVLGKALTDFKDGQQPDLVFQLPTLGLYLQHVFLNKFSAATRCHGNTCGTVAAG